MAPLPVPEQKFYETSPNFTQDPKEEYKKAQQKLIRLGVKAVGASVLLGGVGELIYKTDSLGQLATLSSHVIPTSKEELGSVLLFLGGVGAAGIFLSVTNNAWKQTDLCAHKASRVRQRGWSGHKRLFLPAAERAKTALGKWSRRTALAGLVGLSSWAGAEAVAAGWNATETHGVEVAK